MKTIEITPEMMRHSIGYRLSLRYMAVARTEAAAGAWRASAERHRTQLGWLLDEAIDPVSDATIARIVAADTERVDESAAIAADGIDLAVAVPAEDTTCAE